MFECLIGFIPLMVLWFIMYSFIKGSGGDEEYLKTVMTRKSWRMLNRNIKGNRRK